MSDHPTLATAEEPPSEPRDAQQAEAGTYFAIVSAIDAERSRVYLDSVPARGSAVTATGPTRELMGQIRRFWEAAFALSHRPRTSQEVVEDLPENPYESLGIAMRWATVSQAKASDSEWTRALLDRLWVRVEVPPHGVASAHIVLPREAASLNRAFSSDLWKRAPAARVSEAISSVGLLKEAAFLHVNQAAAIALLDDKGIARAFVDTGRDHGSPTKTTFCVCKRPIVILTHWHKDHWSAAEHDDTLQTLTWIVPHHVRAHGPQKGTAIAIGAQGTQFASRVAKRGQLLVVKKSNRPKGNATSALPSQAVFISHARGNDLNSSGLIVSVRDTPAGSDDASQYWLFAGDARYDRFAAPAPHATVLQATHHGGTFGRQVTVSPAGGYARLVYSYRPGHSYGHPTSSAMAAHEKVGWLHGPLSSPKRPSEGAHSRCTALPSAAAILTGWENPGGGNPSYLRTHHLAQSHGILLRT